MGSNLIPLMILAAGVTANADKLKSLIGYSKTIAVQAELHEISKMIILDHVGGVELPTPETFPQYLRENMRPQKAKNGIKRDLSSDQWGTEYHYQYDSARNRIRVISAGADFKFGTADDLYSERDAG